MSSVLTTLNLPVTQAVTKDDYSLLKKGIWAYFLLLIFEGALRKWFLPALSTPLLIVRDPLALWLVIESWRRGLILRNYYTPVVVFIGLAGIYTAILSGHGNLLVAMYGARVFFFHFPLIFVIGKIFTREDILKIGKAVLLISIPSAVLIALQFYSPQTAWVNRSVGGDEGSGFTGALGFFRPSGTFSFTNGNTLLFGLSGCFVFYFWFHVKTINRLLLIGATLALIIAIPLSISRSLFYHVAVIVLFALLSITRNPANLGKIAGLAIAGLIAFLILSQYSFFTTAIEAFTARFEGATQWEGGVQGTVSDRYVGGMFNSFNFPPNLPFFGYGIGMGSNVGGMLLSGEQTMLIYAEDEWARLIGEMGPLLGLSIVAARIILTIELALKGFNKIAKGDLLPWMLMSFGVVLIPQGQWGQATTLGFSILITGLIVASMQPADNEANDSQI
jgi:hypothetical protein